MFDGDRQLWVLRDHRGDPVPGATMTVAVVTQDLAGMNAFGARRGWPELVPGLPWIHCVLTGGPLDGLHHFVDPRDQEGAPDQLVLDLDQPLPAMPPGRGPEAGVAVAPAVYRRQVKVCSHGNACPWPYRFDDGKWGPPGRA